MQQKKTILQQMMQQEMQQKKTILQHKMAVQKYFYQKH